MKPCKTTSQENNYQSGSGCGKNENCHDDDLDFIEREVFPDEEVLLFESKCGVGDVCSANEICIDKKCTCKNGLGGVQCDIKVICANDCSGHGKCVLPSGRDCTYGNCEGSCECLDYWGGESCDISMKDSPKCHLDCGDHGV
jgi:hypothetical protein